MTHHQRPLRAPARLPSAQQGQAGRRALFITAGLAAAGTGVWWAWQRNSGTQPLHHPHASHADGAAPAQPSASQPLIVKGDVLNDAFWRLSFDTPQGGALPFSALKGKPLLLNFWATWCPPCVKEMPELDRFGRDFSPAGWQVVGLAIDGPTPVREFIAKVRVGFAIGLAGFEGTELSQALGNTAGGLPFTVLIDAQSRIRHRKMGATSHEELARWARGMKGP